MKALYIMYITLLLSPVTIFAQKEATHWNFGYNAALEFRDNGPVATQGSALRTQEGCASISGRDGKLLFYTDGMQVFNRNNEIMPNGSGLLGHLSSTNSGYIVPLPGSDSIYYLFSVGDKGKGLLHYSIVNMKLDNGLGDVSEKNITVADSASEKICAVKHVSGEAYWIISQAKNTKYFRALLLDKDGLHPDPVISYEGNQLSGGSDLNIGQLKASMDGKKLAAAIFGAGAVIIMDFDAATGVISNSVYLKSEKFYDVYGVEFSPNGKYLYVSCSRSLPRLYQLKLDGSMPDDIIKNAYLLYIGSGTVEFGALQIAPDGKIYHAVLDQDHIGVINYPDEPGFDCIYQPKSVDLGKKHCYWGLPSFINDYLYDYNITYKHNGPVCEGDTIRLFAETIPEVSYTWTGPKGLLSNSPAYSLKSDTSDSGMYTLKTIRYGKVKEYKFNVEVSKRPKAKITADGPFELCSGDSLTLYAITDCPECNIRWSTGETTDSIRVNKTDKYWVDVTNEYGCSATDSADINFNKSLDIFIDAQNGLKLCNGESLKLEVKPALDNYEYLWSTGETAHQIYVNKTGTYHVRVEGPSGCTGEDSVYIEFVDPPYVSIEPETSPPYCSGETINLKAVADQPDVEFRWEDGSTGKSLMVNKTGFYKLYGTNQTGCTDSTAYFVEFNDAVAVKIVSEDGYEICPGEELTLKTNYEFESYMWSTGDTGREVTVSEPGRYSVIAHDLNGCAAYDTVDISARVTDLVFDPAGGLVFDSLATGEKSEKGLVILNLSSGDVIISSAGFKNGTAFSTGEGPAIPITLAVDGTDSIPVVFSPSEENDYSDTLLIEVEEPCHMVYEYPVSGRGYVKKQEKSLFQALVIVPEIQEDYDKDVCLRLKARLVNSDTVLNGLTFEGDLSMPAGSFLPDDIYPSEINSGGRIIHLEKDQVTLTGQLTPLLDVCGYLLFSDRLEFPVILDKPAWRTGDSIKTTIENGLVRLHDICFRNFRLVKKFMDASVEISPNPAGSAVNVSVKSSESGWFELDVYTLNGEKIDSKKWHNDGRLFKNEYSYDLSGFASGLYQVVVKTPTKVIAKKLVVL